jgi:hypothetical protein
LAVMTVDGPTLILGAMGLLSATVLVLFVR